MSDLTHSTETEFWNKKAFKVIVGYLVGTWTFLEFLSFILVKLNISPVWAEIFLYVMLMLLPSILTVAFLKKTVRTTRFLLKLIPALNILIIVMVVVFKFWGRDLGMMTKKVSYMDESGREHVKNVLKEDFTKQIYVFPFEKTSDNVSVSKQWYGQGIALATSFNLSQFQGIMTGLGATEETATMSLREKLDQLNYVADYIIIGNWDFEKDSIKADLTLYNKKSKISFQGSVKASSIFALSDSIKGAVLKELQIHKSIKSQIDLPFEQFMTNNEEAFRKLSEGDYQGAIKEDENYSFAYLLELDESLRDGSPKEYVKEIAYKGLTKIGKLPDSDRMTYKAFYHLANDDKVKGLKAFQKAIELNPGDERLRYNYLYYLCINGYYDEAVDFSFDRVAQKFDYNYAYTGFLLLKVSGKTESIRNQLNKYKWFLADFQYQTAFGEMALMDGDPSSAKEYFEDAFVQQPENHALDTLMKVADYQINTTANSREAISRGLIGNYLEEQSNLAFEIRFEDDLLKAIYPNDLPWVLYLMNDSSTYAGQPYFVDIIPVEKRIFKRGKSGQIVLCQHNQRHSFVYNPPDTAYTAYSYKYLPELRDGLLALKNKDFQLADSLFHKVLAYDSGYYFVQNFTKAIEFIASEKNSSMLEKINGSEFENFGSGNQIFFTTAGGDLTIQENGKSSKAFFIEKNWIIETAKKNLKYHLTENVLEVHIYNHQTKSYDLKSSYTRI